MQTDPYLQGQARKILVENFQLSHTNSYVYFLYLTVKILAPGLLIDLVA